MVVYPKKVGEKNWAIKNEFPLGFGFSSAFLETQIFIFAKKSKFQKLRGPASPSDFSTILAYIEISKNQLENEKNTEISLF